MSKLRSQILIAIVLMILGFMLSYEYKVLSKKYQSTPTTDVNITEEITQLKKQRDEMTKKITELQDSVSKYETEATQISGTSQETLKQLNDTRMLLGNVEVQGQGIKITITPKANLDKNPVGSDKLSDRLLIYLINELNFSDAEAITVNGIRVTYRTGIRNAADYILVGDDKVSPDSVITVLAIGNKDKLLTGMDFQGEFNDFKSFSVVTYARVDNITMQRANKSISMQYAKAVSK
ncbi:MAG TPA: DUF881 domain-containing protein [Clostridiaceae bacterium]